MQSTGFITDAVAAARWKRQQGAAKIPTSGGAANSSLAKQATGWAGTPWSNVSTSPVKSFFQRQRGSCYDMVGNVEWTATPENT
ncbi:SUMF1/EgtB/PvdO family nonheme iron enzyme [Vibrio lentus]|nr:SUMF1/EgtB/PvdO family nonheme iron enzyme [Vibrio lentus]